MKTIAKIENNSSESALHEVGNLFNHIGSVVSFNLDLQRVYNYLNQFYENNEFILIYKGSSHVAVVDKVTTKRLIIITEE